MNYLTELLRESQLVAGFDPRICYRSLMNPTEVPNMTAPEPVPVVSLTYSEVKPVT